MITGVWVDTGARTGNECGSVQVRVNAGDRTVNVCVLIQVITQVICGLMQVIVHYR